MINRPLDVAEPPKIRDDGFQVKFTLWTSETDIRL